MATVQAGGAPTIPPGVLRGGERLPVAPFLTFCERLEAELCCEDRFPAISTAVIFDPLARLVESFGWDADSGLRRLRRWRNPEQGDGHNGFASRALIEDALTRAGAVFYEVYPDALPPPVYSSRFGVGRFLNDEQMIATHTIYTQGKLTTREVAALIWERFGYASPVSAMRALLRGWRALGLALRQCDKTVNGRPCQLHPMHGSDSCYHHRAPVGWQLPAELIADARTLHEEGVSFNALGKRLLDRTPWRNEHYLSCRLSDVAIAQGWHATRHLGSRTRQFQTTSEDIA